jgi:hypothetical protein
MCQRRRLPAACGMKYEAKTAESQAAARDRVEKVRFFCFLFHVKIRIPVLIQVLIRTNKSVFMGVPRRAWGYQVPHGTTKIHTARTQTHGLLYTRTLIIQHLLYLYNTVCCIKIEFRNNVAGRVNAVLNKVLRYMYCQLPSFKGAVTVRTAGFHLDTELPSAVGARVFPTAISGC